MVGVKLAAARTGPLGGGTGRVADGPGRPEVGEHAPEGITPKTRHPVASMRHATRSFGEHASRNTPNH